MLATACPVATFHTYQNQTCEEMEERVYEVDELSYATHLKEKKRKEKREGGEK
jgi:hypothetical protein